MAQVRVMYWKEIPYAVRASDLVKSGAVEAPPRFVTRPARAGDDARESVHLSREEFDRREREGSLGLRWERPMEGGRVERYGFPAVAAGRLPLYSGNNALYAHAGRVRPVGILRRALFVGVFAPDEVRQRRLCARSPDLCRDRPEEVRHRLADAAEAVRPHVHVVVANHGDLENAAPTEMVALVAAVGCRALHVYTLALAGLVVVSVT